MIALQATTSSIREAIRAFASTFIQQVFLPRLAPSLGVIGRAINYQTVR